MAKYSTAYLGMQGSEKIFKPQYMTSWLYVYQTMCQQIVTTPDSSAIDAATDVLIGFVISPNEKAKLYKMRAQLYHDAIAEAEKGGRKLSDNEKTSIKRSTNLRVVASTNEQMATRWVFRTTAK
jgi:hypothetical protein